MGCTSSSAVREPEPKKNEEEISTARSKASGRNHKTNRHSSMYTTYAEPGSETGLDDQRMPSTGSLAAISKEQVQLQPEPQVAPMEETVVSGEVTAGGDPQPQPQTMQVRSPSKGSLIRDGVYYSESELEEGVTPWQPKYWTPERIGKWVEDTEFPEGMKFADIRKAVLAGGVGKKSPPPNGNTSRKTRPTSNSIG